MPGRYLREGIITSERVDKLSESAEVFYRRLMSVVDDYGRYYAHPGLLRAACFPLRVDRVKEAEVKRWLNECSSAGLVVIYGSEKYMMLLDFKQQARRASKFPEPTADELLNKVSTADKQNCSVSVSVSGTVTVPEVDDGFEEFWKAYPKKRGGKKDAMKAWRKPGRPDIATILSAIEAQKNSEQWKRDGGQYIPYPATWLNRGQWDDELFAAARRRGANI